MQYCKLNNTACKLPTCKNGEKITGVDSDSDDHKLEPCVDIKSFEWHAGDTYEDNTHILTCPDTENLDIHQLRHRIHHTVRTMEKG